MLNGTGIYVCNMILIVHSWSVIPAITDNYYVEKDNNSWPIKITIEKPILFWKETHFCGNVRWHICYNIIQVSVQRMFGCLLQPIQSLGHVYLSIAYLSSTLICGSEIDKKTRSVLQLLMCKGDVVGFSASTVEGLLLSWAVCCEIGVTDGVVCYWCSIDCAGWVIWQGWRVTVSELISTRAF